MAEMGVDAQLRLSTRSIRGSSWAHRITLHGSALSDGCQPDALCNMAARGAVQAFGNGRTSRLAKRASAYDEAQTQLRPHMPLYSAKLAAFFLRAYHLINLMVYFWTA
jgi:hypothetical protein